jgi:hypothetical protein
MVFWFVFGMLILLLCIGFFVYTLSNTNQCIDSLRFTTEHNFPDNESCTLFRSECVSSDVNGHVSLTLRNSKNQCFYPKSECIHGAKIIYDDMFEKNMVLSVTVKVPNNPMVDAYIGLEGFAYGAWPASGSIDIVHTIGNSKNYPNMHCGDKYYERTIESGILPQRHVSSRSAIFSTYLLTWTDEGFAFYKDVKYDEYYGILDKDGLAGIPYATILNCQWQTCGNDLGHSGTVPFDKPLKIVASLKYGGESFSTNCAWNSDCCKWYNQDPVRMCISELKLIKLKKN